MRKPISDMTKAEIEQEIDWNQSYFDDCEKIDQGISSKDYMRQRALKAALAEREG